MKKAKSIFEFLRSYRKTIQMLGCTLAVIVLAFIDGANQDFEPNELAYITLGGLAGFIVQQSVKEKVNESKQQTFNEEKDEPI